MVKKQNAYEQLLFKFDMIRTPNTLEEWDSYYDLRYRILRQPWNQVRGIERNDGDSSAIHLAYFESKSILGVGRLDILTEDEAQIRFMAVENEQQGKGIGRLLMEHLETMAKNEGCKRSVLHAREIALPFYQKLGYQSIEKSHLLFDEIQHYLMHKNL